MNGDVAVHIETAMRAVVENVNGWDIVKKSRWTNDEGETCSPYGTHPDRGTNWRIEECPGFLKQNRLNGCVFGRGSGGAFETIEEATENCMAYRPSRLSPGD